VWRGSWRERWDHQRVQRVVILGRGGAGKSALARQLGEITKLPVVELDTLFWDDGLNPAEPDRWAVSQREITGREDWIIDGDLGPYDSALDARLLTADTVIVLDFSLLRCAFRTLRRGPERADYWRWVWSYRRRYLPALMRAIAANARHAEVHILRNPAAVRRFVAAVKDGGSRRLS
jgi:adenylate kinase family enzyme